MAFTEDQKTKIVEALRQRQQQVRARGAAGIVGGCPICGNRNFNLNPSGLVYWVLQESPGTGIQLSGDALPNIAFICDNCGNTQLVNALILGLGDLLGIPKKAEPAPEQPAQPALPEQTKAE